VRNLLEALGYLGRAVGAMLVYGGVMLYFSWVFLRHVG
jgi:hypothetical protein